MCGQPRQPSYEKDGYCLRIMCERGNVCSPLPTSRSWSKRTIVAVVPSGTFNFNSLSVISTLMAPDGVDIGGESVLHVSSCVVSDCLKDMEQMAPYDRTFCQRRAFEEGLSIQKGGQAHQRLGKYGETTEKRVLYISGLYEKNVVILHRSKTETILETVFEL